MEIYNQPSKMRIHFDLDGECGISSVCLSVTRLQDVLSICCINVPLPNKYA